MPLPDNLLSPIPGDNPCGGDLRYTPIYDKIKEARREEEEVQDGEWKTEGKKADYPQVVKLAVEALSTTKDLQIAAWLTDALLRTEGYAGLKQGLDLIQGLLSTFWDGLYPQLEDGDAELRAAPLEWIGFNLVLPVQSASLNKAKHGWLDYTESRKLGYEEQADSDDKKAARAKLIEQGRVAPEAFDKSFAETPKAFYVAAEAALDGSMATVQAMDKLCQEKFGNLAPSFTDLKKVLETVRHTAHLLLQKKRETEPDVVEAGAEAAPEGAGEGAGGEGAAAGSGVAGRTAGGAGGIVIPLADGEPAQRRDAISSVARAAAALRKLDPYSPAPYLMLRGLRWGELRAALQSSDLTLLEGPPTVLRQHIKRLAIEGKWEELLETAENAMSLPCSRGWLDLQRFVVDACVGLGSKYDGIAVAIRSELKTLLHDLPQLLEINLLDDTSAANSETRVWLKELAAEPPTQPAPEAAPADAPLAEARVWEDHSAPGWHRKFVDSYDLARQALSAGQAEKALDLMRREVERQLSGRGQFFRKLQLVDICIAAGQPRIAQPFIDDIVAIIENNHVEEWEDRAIVAKALVMILKNSRRVQEDDTEKYRLFQKVVRLDPVQAISCVET
ncbi:MAG: type VI secretion system protein TssA [Terriglobia bacterium]|jgi:type VI secretion system protein ImpA